MSLIRLLLSGLLVASGLILGTFTLLGYFDPQWERRQAQAAGAPERSGETGKPVGAFHGKNRSRFVAARTERAGPDPRPQAAASTPARTQASQGPLTKAAMTKPAAKPANKNKLAEKSKKAPPPPQQQASFVWPWNLFNN
jgi:hypothetical protein